MKCGKRNKIIIAALIVVIVLGLAYAFGEKKLTTIDQDYLQKAIAGTPKNTSEMVDKIASIAKNDSEKASNELLNEAIAFIRDNYPQYYDGAEEMELTMYYGYLLDYKFNDSDPRSKLGTDTYQAVKYVYRNVETVLDDATQENLRQIEKSLSKIK